jgi:hypothetical protein
MLVKLVVATVSSIRPWLCRNASSWSRFPPCTWADRSQTVQAKVKLVPRSPWVGYAPPVARLSIHRWPWPVQAASGMIGERAADRELVGEEKKVQGPLCKLSARR